MEKIIQELVNTLTDDQFLKFYFNFVENSW